LGFGQLPIRLYFVDKLKPREYIGDGIECNQISQLVSAIPSVNPPEVVYGLFSSTLFNQWWAEWKDHLFCQAVKTFCQRLDDNFEADDEVRNP